MQLSVVHRADVPAIDQQDFVSRHHPGAPSSEPGRSLSDEEPPVRPLPEHRADGPGLPGAAHPAPGAPQAAEDEQKWPETP